MPYLGQSISFVYFYQEIFVLTPPTTNAIEGNYSLLKLLKINVFQIQSFEMLEKVSICKIIKFT